METAQIPDSRPRWTFVFPWISALLTFVIATLIFIRVGKPPINIVYHVPIYPLVGYVMSIHLLSYIYGPRHGYAWMPTFLVGLTLSILRETHKWPASGHTLWCVLLAAFLAVEFRGRQRQATLLCLALVFCQITGMKLFVEYQYDPPGLICGLMAGAILSLWPLWAHGQFRRTSAAVKSP